MLDFDLKEPTGRLARWQLWTTKLDNKVVFELSTHYLAAYTISHLPIATSEKTREKEEEIYDDIKNYCIPAQILDALKTPQEEVATLMGTSTTTLL